MIDIERLVLQIQGVAQLPGLEKAWKWSPSSRFTFALALDSEANFAFQINCRDSYDEDLVRAVLEFSRSHTRRLVGDAGEDSFLIVHDFSHESTGFDSVASASPAVHGYHRERKDSLNDAVWAVFPAFQCEFSGTETVDEARHRFKRMLRPSHMARPPSPYLRMRYDNTKTLAGSIGLSRGFTTPDVLIRELNLLEGAPGSFVEFENSRGNVRTVQWDDSWIVDGVLQRDLNWPAELPAWVYENLGCP